MNAATRGVWSGASARMRAVLVVAVLLGATSLILLSFDVAVAPIGVIGVAIVAAVLSAAVLSAIGAIVIPRGVVTANVVVGAVAWGSLVATFLASLLNDLGPGIVIAPFVEELLKVTGVVVVLRCAGGRVTPIRGFSIGFVVGAAFDVYESLLYVVVPDETPAAGSEVSEAVHTAWLRLVLGFGLHAFTAALTGAAVAYVIARTGRAIGRVSVGVLASAIVLHLVWDVGGVLGIVGYGLMAVDYVALIVLFVVGRRRSITASPPELPGPGVPVSQ